MMSDIRLLTSRSFNQLAQDTAPGPIWVGVCADADDVASMTTSATTWIKVCISPPLDSSTDSGTLNQRMSGSRPCPRPWSVRSMLDVYFALAIFSALLNEPYR